MESIAKELDILEYKDLFFSENDNRPIIIYGYNNSGKTQFLKKLTKKICYYNLEKIYNKDEKNLKCSIFLGTNRLEEERIGTTPYDYSLKQLHIGYELTRLSDMDKYDERYISSVRIAAMNDPEFIEKVSNAISNLFGLEENFVVSQNEINNYSDGVQNVLNIYSFIYIAEKVYDLDLKSSAKIKGIVLIDEIELFLHIKVQSELFNQLQKDFDYIKFIVTTHSSLLIQRVKNPIIFNISDYKLSLVEQNYYYNDLEMINQNLFDVSKYPEEFKQLMDYFNESLQKNHEVESNKFSELSHKLFDKYPHLQVKINNMLLDILRKKKKNNDIY